MSPSLTALNTTCANYVRPLALLLSVSLFTAALPVGSLSQTVQPEAAQSTTDLSASSSLSTQEATPVEATQAASIAEAYGKLSLSFEANKGQFDRQVQFMARGVGYSLFLTSTEAVLVLNNAVADKDNIKGKIGGAKSPAALQAKIREDRLRGVEAEAAGRAKDVEADKQENTVLRMKLEGANSAAQAQGIDELPGKTNYFIGNDPEMWHTEIPSYARVMYRDVYPGVDLVYYGKEQQLEYDFVVAPGSDPNNIRLAFEGAQSIDVDAQGDLVLHTAGGDVRQHKPVVYQEIDGVKREIASRYVLKDSERVGFQVDAYDTNKPLVIDPVLIYSTYLGGSGSEEGFSIAVDAAGNAYVAGRTGSLNFPVVNPEQGSYGRNSDAFISKLNRAGSALIYSTYLGGLNPDRAYSVAVDTRGRAYVTGHTYSPDFPLMNPVQDALGGKLDAFVAKLSPAGSSLVYSTYLGGSSFEIGRDLAIDTAGNAYVTGYTDSHDLTTANPLQAAKGGDQAFKSTDGGGAWSVSDTGLNVAFVNDMAIDPSNPATLYAATELGVFKSTDSGSSWKTSNTGLSNPKAVNGDAYRLVIDPANPSTIYAATSNAINKSTNGGNSWSVSYGGVPNGFYIFDALVIDPLHTSTLYASSEGYPLKSTDAGGSWQRLTINDYFDNPEYITAFAVDPANSSIVYAGAWGRGVYRSTNGGATWSLISGVVTSGSNIFPLFINDLVINPGNPSIIYASTRSHGIYKSTDAGLNWSTINTGLPQFREIYVLTLDPANPTTLYAGTNGNLFKSTNAGGSWSPSETGLTNKDVGGIVIDPTDTSKVYVGTSSGPDAYITKLNTAGSSLLYSTYLGGNERDAGQSISLGVDDNPSLTGYTASNNFPTANPWQATFASPDSSTTDAFVTKLDASGSSLSYSTYLGGNGDEQGTGIAVDQNGNAYVTGFASQFDRTLPMNFPVTPGAFQTVYKNEDAFVSKLNAAGSNLTYSTYLGGNAPDAAYAIAVNSSGQAFVTGKTNSTDFPLAGAIQSSLVDYPDAFVTRLNTAGSALVFSTYLGGFNSFSIYEEQGNGIAVDAANNAYVIGTTDSSYFPTTPNSLKRFKSGISDAFIAKIGAPPASVRLSGKVLLDGRGLAGVTLTLRNRAGGVLQTTTTVSNGSYFFDVPGGGDYTITPSKDGYQFSPASLSLTDVGSNLTVQNFTATILNFSIFNRVVGVDSHGVPGVRFTLTGSRSGACVTDDDGSCTFNNLPSAGNYTVTPTKAGGVFNPASKTFHNLSADQFPIFKAAFSISGQVRGINGVGISGITVTLSGFRTATTKTDSNGNYTFVNVAAGAEYFVTPTATGVTFIPEFKHFDRLISAQTVNFQGVAGITGKIKRAGTTSGISGVTVRLSGSRIAATRTDANGFYTFANLPLGGNYTVTPSRSGFSFNPPSKTFTNLKTSQTVSTASFVGTPTN